jgi:hypothetical protein
MPRLPSVFAGEFAMDNILEAYVRAVLPHGFITAPSARKAFAPWRDAASTTAEIIDTPSGCEFDLGLLHSFLAEYNKTEVALFRRHAVRSGQLTEVQGGCGLGVQTLDERTWIAQYERTTTVRTPEDKEAACAAYVQGLRFVWNYYSTTSAQTSWTWFFPFHHGPFTHDVADYVRRCATGVTPFAAPKLEADAPPPFVQLLCILPPTSCSLLPKAVRRIMIDGPVPADKALTKRCFPLRWSVDFTTAQEMEHLATPLLPFTDLAALDAAARAILAEAESNNEVTADVLARNRNLAEGSCVIAAMKSRAVTKGNRGDPSGWSVLGMPLIAAPEEDDSESESARTIVMDVQFTPPPIPSPAVWNALNDVVAPNGAASAAAAISGSGSAKNAGGGGGKSKKKVLAKLPGVRPHVTSGMQGGIKLLPTIDSNVLGGILWRNESASAMRLLTTASPLSASFAFADAWIFTAIAATAMALVGWVMSATGGEYSLLDSLYSSLGLTLPGAVFAALFLQASTRIANATTSVIPPRNLSRDSRCDWLCPECGSLNFGINRRCFRCALPFTPATCAPVALSRFERNPPLYNPDHSVFNVACTVRLSDRVKELAL